MRMKDKNKGQIKWIECTNYKVMKRGRRLEILIMNRHNVEVGIQTKMRVKGVTDQRRQTFSKKMKFKDRNQRQISMFKCTEYKAMKGRGGT